MSSTRKFIEQRSLVAVVITQRGFSALAQSVAGDFLELLLRFTQMLLFE
jgi:hypothetical protein